MLPQKLQPFKDEIAESWAYRLAIANGFDNINSLFKNHFKFKLGRKNDYTGKNIFALLDEVGIRDYSDFILHHTIYTVSSLFLDTYRQSIYLDMLSGKNRKQFSVMEKMHKFCPVCFEEENCLKTFHNMPGVCVCPIHQIPLYNFLNNEPVKENINQEDLTYAIFCYKLYQNNYDFDVSFLKHNYSFNTGVLKLMASFSDLNFPKIEQIKLEKDNEYIILRAQNNLVELIHQSCGTHFCMNAKAFNLGIKCPSCRDEDEELFEQIVNNSGKYKMIDYGKNKIKVRHEVCGREYEVRCTNFVNGARCVCETDWTKDRLERMFEEKYSEFVVDKYEDERVYLTHKKCGKSFDVNIRKWFKKPNCRICNPKFELNEETVSEKISETGFKLISFDTDSRTAEVVCPNGHTKKINYYSFMDKPTCLICTLNNTDKQKFIRYIKENYKENEIVFFDDLRLKFPHPKLDYMQEIGYRRLMPGIYAKDELSDEEIIRQRYLHRKKAIGYSYGESFAHELGMTEKPKIYSYCTLMDSGAKGRFVQIRNTKIRIRGVINGFDGDYWREWQLLDFLYCVGKYRGTISIDEVIKLLVKYIEENGLNKAYLIEHMIDKKCVYTTKIMEKLNEKKK